MIQTVIVPARSLGTIVGTATVTNRCPVCNGEGFYNLRKCKGRADELRWTEEDCEECKGTGRVASTVALIGKAGSRA